MTALELIKEDYKSALETFEGTVADVTEEMLYKDPGGKALPLGATYAHLVFSEDLILNGMVRKQQPLCESSFKDNTGTSEPMAAMDENWSVNNEKWSKSVKFDFPKFIEYKKAVFAETQKYLDSLKDEDLDQEIDLGDWGKRSLASVIYSMITGHTNNLSGEISVLKGIQGYKGYPF